MIQDLLDDNAAMSSKRRNNYVGECTRTMSPTYDLTGDIFSGCGYEDSSKSGRTFRTSAIKDSIDLENVYAILLWSSVTDIPDDGKRWNLYFLGLKPYSFS
jgi:hypothetical protein